LAGRQPSLNAVGRLREFTGCVNRAY
jgi:hypothetical protein